jgi:hypothetical protein
MCAVADFKAAALDKTGAAEAEPAIDSSNAPAKPTVIVRWIKLDLLMIISLLGIRWTQDHLSHIVWSLQVEPAVSRCWLQGG